METLGGVLLGLLFWTAVLFVCGVILIMLAVISLTRVEWKQRK